MKLLELELRPERLFQAHARMTDKKTSAPSRHTPVVRGPVFPSKLLDFWPDNWFTCLKIFDDRLTTECLGLSTVR